MALDPGTFRRRERTIADPVPELTLVEQLEAQSKAESISARALMRAIGVDQGHWSKVRRGQERFGVQSCTKIVAAYPAMRAAAARYLTASYGRPCLSLLEDASHLVQAGRDADRRRTAHR